MVSSTVHVILLILDSDTYRLYPPYLPCMNYLEQLPHWVVYHIT